MKENKDAILKFRIQTSKKKVFLEKLKKEDKTITDFFMDYINSYLLDK